MSDNHQSAGRHRSARRGRGTRRLFGGTFLTIGILAVTAVAVLLLVPEAVPKANSVGPQTSNLAGTALPTSVVPTADVLSTSASGHATTTPSSSSTSAAASVPSSAPAGPIGRDECTIPGGRLIVAAAPELAAVLAHSASGVAGCSVSVVPVDPADFVADWQQWPVAQRPQAWVPDSAVWATQAGEKGVPVGRPGPSVARSPLVLAVSATAAGRITAGRIRPTVDRVLRSRTAPTPVRIGLADLGKSFASNAMLVELQTSSLADPSPHAAQTWAMRSSPNDLPTTSSTMLAGLAAAPDTALPVSEQSVWAYNRTHPAVRAVAIYPTSASIALDYPVVPIAPTATTATVIADLTTIFRSANARTMLLQNGFRDGSGAADTTLAADPGLSTAAPANGAAPSASAIANAQRDYTIINEPSQLLAVIDISGSMQSQVPGDPTGRSRLDYARAAAIRGLSLYPMNSRVGLWVFSRAMTGGNTDYRQIFPLTRLESFSHGFTGQQQMAAALRSVQVNPDGGTGLYDTTLAAVRFMRSHWDPSRVNAVLILSDGQNDDQGSISLASLLSTLRDEQAGGRQVPVVAVAFGPNSDVSAMSQISAATGGTTYIVTDPRQIGEIFLDAVGRRICRPDCSQVNGS